LRGDDDASRRLGVAPQQLDALRPELVVRPAREERLSVMVKSSKINNNAASDQVASYVPVSHECTQQAQDAMATWEGQL